MSFIAVDKCNLEEQNAVVVLL